MKAEGRLSKTQVNKRDNKQPIGKQHADNQSEEGKSLRGGKSALKKKTFTIVFCSYKATAGAQ